MTDQTVTELDAAVLAAEARRLVDHFDRWDSMFTFITFTREGDRLVPGIYTSIDPRCTVQQVARAMIKMAADDACAGRSAYAYAIQIEAWSVELPPDASDEDKATLDAEYRARKLDKHPGRRECARAYVCDIHGRMWEAVWYRGGTEVQEAFRQSAPDEHRGIIDGALYAIARTTALILHGLPPESEGEREMLKLAEAVAAGHV